MKEEMEKDQFIFGHQGLAEKVSKISLQLEESRLSLKLGQTRVFKKSL